ncbi:hypothetical protein L0F63_000471, partial [Massospora cicadina]
MKFHSIFTLALVQATTFKVADVKLDSTHSYRQQSLRAALNLEEAYKKSKVEAVSNTSTLNPADIGTVYGINGLLKAAHVAFAYHHGLTLSPEVVYIAILQALSTHVNLDREAHRNELGINHTGKIDLVLRMHEYHPGLKSNDWQRVFNLFKNEIGDIIPKDLKALLDKSYSTSTSLSTAVNSLTIMDIYKGFFSYAGLTSCGIPKMTIEGNQTDWIELRSSTEELLAKVKGTETWASHLLPVLDNFIKAKQQPTTINKGEEYSSSPVVSGWINVFFPYVAKNLTLNPCLDWKNCLKNNK